MRTDSQWAHVTGVTESGDTVVDVIPPTSSSSMTVWQWVSDLMNDLRRLILGASHRPLCASQCYPVCCYDLTLFQWALGSSCCRTMPGLVARVCRRFLDDRCCWSANRHMVFTAIQNGVLCKILSFVHKELKLWLLSTYMTCPQA